jgi:protein YibB
MSDITIVTAFYDIGRSEWTPENGHPHYLHRPTETYIERFSHLAQLENEMIVFTSTDLLSKLQPLRAGKEDKTKFVVLDIFTQYAHIKKAIEEIQALEEYQNMISPSQRANPEYWNADYVLVNLLKTMFVTSAIRHNLVSNELVAWLDFGYCRTADKIPASKKWSYDFDPTKIHLFDYMDYDDKPITEVIANNIVYILGAKIVGGRNVWPDFLHAMNIAFRNLVFNSLIDDDQTLLLMAAMNNPDLVQLHRIPDHQLGLDPFVIFDKFNEVKNV